MKRATLWLALLGMAFGGILHAQDDDEDANRGVARISLLAGDVSVRRGDSGEWVAAAVNAPLLADDTLSTGSGARAEVQFDNSNMIRLAAGAELQLAEISDRRYVAQIARGTITFRILREFRTEVELNTPCVSIRPVATGAYRVTVEEDGETRITVRSGEVEIYTPTGSERLRAGRTMEVRGTASDPQFRLMAEIPRDSWDDWNVTRDRRLQASRSVRYTDRTVYGVEDLDDYGAWVSVSSYGYVWRPRVAVGWSPYYDGRWAWMDYYGWTWVSYDPWGWAPYHYGRWFWDVGYGWCWWPGGYGIRHRWSPALVAFFGYGHGGVGIGFGYGRVGWVPLGPREPYHRWYGRDYYRGYRDGGFPGGHMHLDRDYDVRRNYMNARAPNGMAGMDAGGFGRGGRADRLRPDDVTRAGLVRGVLPVAPGRESQRFADRDPGRVPGNPATANRTFAGRTQVWRGDRVPFEDQRRGMERGIQNASTLRPGEPGGARDNNRLAGGPAAGPGRGGPAAGTEDRGGPRTQDLRTGENGWRRLGEGAPGPARERAGAEQPARTARPGEAMRPGGDGAAAGWRTFGGPAGSAATGAGPQNRRTEAQANGPAASGGEWRTFENRPARQPEAGAPESRGAARTQPGQTDSGRAVRINPPIVRERPSRPEAGGNAAPPRETRQPAFGGGSGGGNTPPQRSAPAYSSPGGERRSNPGSIRESRPTYSAPSGGNSGSMRSARPAAPGGGGSMRAPSAPPSGGGRVSGGGGARPSGGGGGARPSGGGRNR